MNKKNEQRDSTTDFFLKFMSKEKDKQDQKHTSSKTINSEIDSKGETIVKGIVKIVNLINSTVDKMLQSSLSLKILSFLLATILLFTVNGGSFESIFSTPNSGDYIKDIPIKIENLQNDYVVTGMPKTVSVGLVGPSIDIYNTKLMKKYEIYADFSGVGEGEQTIELKSRNFSNELEVLIVPQTVSVTISQKVTKTFELGYRFKNEESLTEKSSVSVDSIEHSEVEVKGSQAMIDNVYSVEAIIDLEGVTDSFTQNCKIKAYDRSGKVLDVDVVPSTVKVDCSLSNYSKTVPLVPEFTGNIAEGFAVDKITFSTSEVQIFGDESKLKNIDDIKVKVDVSDLQEGKTFKDLKLVNLPDVNKMSFTTVDGTISVAPAVTKQFTDVKVKLRKGENQEVEMANNSFTVNIIGTQNNVDKLKKEAIELYIDTSGLKKGRHNLKIEVELGDKTLRYQIDNESLIRVNVIR